MNNEIKSGFVSIIGSPNAGKSSLINELVGQKISIVTDKVQTTRNITRGIISRDSYQIVFLDTPGIHKSRNKLSDYMLRQIKQSLVDIDVLIYILDAKIGLREKEWEIIKKLKKIDHKNLIIIINKIDLLSQIEVQILFDQIEKQNITKTIIPISVIKIFNIKLVEEEIVKKLEVGPMYYPTEMKSDLPDFYRAGELIREKVIKNTSEEIPHSIVVQVKNIKYGKIVKIEANIFVERDSQKGIIIGQKGNMIKRIGELSRKDLEKEFNSKVFLDLNVKVSSNWRDSQQKLQNLGYED